MKQKPTSNVKGILIVAHKKNEWLLPWWKLGYLMNNPFPVVFVDAGLSDKAKAWCTQCGTLLCFSEEILAKGSLNADKLKIEALKLSPFEETLLIEPFMQVRCDLNSLFGFLSAETNILVAPATCDPHKASSDIIVIKNNPAFLEKWETLMLKGKNSLNVAIVQHAQQAMILPALYNWPIDVSGENPFACICNYKSKLMQSHIKQQIKLLENIVFMKLSFPRSGKKEKSALNAD